VSGGQTEIKTKSKLISNSLILIQVIFFWVFKQLSYIKDRCGGIAIGKETSAPSDKVELTNLELNSLFAPSVTFQV